MPGTEKKVLCISNAAVSGETLEIYTYDVGHLAKSEG